MKTTSMVHDRAFLLLLPLGIALVSSGCVDATKAEVLEEELMEPRDAECKVHIKIEKITDLVDGNYVRGVQADIRENCGRKLIVIVQWEDGSVETMEIVEIPSEPLVFLNAVSAHVQVIAEELRGVVTRIPSAGRYVSMGVCLEGDDNDLDYYRELCGINTGSLYRWDHVGGDWVNFYQQGQDIAPYEVIVCDRGAAGGGADDSIEHWHSGREPTASALPFRSGDNMFTVPLNMGCLSASELSTRLQNLYGGEYSIGVWDNFMQDTSWYTPQDSHCIVLDGTDCGVAVDPQISGCTPIHVFAHELGTEPTWPPQFSPVPEVDWQCSNDAGG